MLVQNGAVTSPISPTRETSHTRRSRLNAAQAVITPRVKTDAVAIIAWPVTSQDPQAQPSTGPAGAAIHQVVAKAVTESSNAATATVHEIAGRVRVAEFPMHPDPRDSSRNSG